jgi:hypothetical protein
MCLGHAAEIDQPGWDQRFPTDLLLTVKAEQLATGVWTIIAKTPAAELARIDL